LPEPPAQSTAEPGAPRFRYTVTDLGTLGGDTSHAEGINNRGQVVGYADTTTDEKLAYREQRAFLWQAGKGMQDLGALGGKESEAHGINDAGQVVGEATTDNTAYAGLLASRAFLWQAGSGMQDLGTLGGKTSEANDINNNGQVLGSADVGNGRIRYKHPFLWRAGQGMQDLGSMEDGWFKPSAINDSGQIVGFVGVEPGSFVFSWGCLWQAGSGLQRLPEGCCPTAINNKGQVVGFADTPSGERHAFQWRAGGGMQDLGTLYGCDSDAKAINNSGQVVGSATTRHGAQVQRKWLSSGPHSPSELPPLWEGVAFLYCDGSMTDLNTMIDPASGWHFTEAEAINDSSQIVGTGKNKAGKLHAFLLTPNATTTEAPKPERESTAEIATATEGPTKPERASTGQSDQPRIKKSVPTGWVKIVNRATGLHLVAPRAGGEVVQSATPSGKTGPRPEVWQIEPAPRHPGYYRIRNQVSGEFLAIDDKSTERGARACTVPHKRGPPTREGWKIEPLGDGFWRIVNGVTGQCLEASGSDGGAITRQSPFREGALEQQWRFEPVKSETASKPTTDGTRREQQPVKSETSSQPENDQTRNEKEPVNAETEPKREQEPITWEIASQPNVDVARRECLPTIYLPRCWFDGSPVAIGPDLGYVYSYDISIDKIIDGRTCVMKVLSPGNLRWNILRIVVKGWPTEGKVTGEQPDLGKTLFRVTGTTDLKLVDGSSIRVYVLEVACPLVIGDVRRVPYPLAKIERILDDHSCIVRPFLKEGDEKQGNQSNSPLRILLKGWPTAGKVKGQKVHLDKALFRVASTIQYEQIDKANNEWSKVYVLEMIDTPSK
jgi:probable HAF family extracellular repeat protein